MLYCKFSFCFVLFVICFEIFTSSTVGQNKSHVFSSTHIMKDVDNTTTEANHVVSTSVRFMSTSTLEDLTNNSVSAIDKTVQEQLWLSDMCAMYAMCEYVSRLEFQYCRCDEECHVYRDCCYNGSTTNNEVTISSNFTFDCVRYNTRSKYKGTYVVTECDQSNPGNETDCEDDDIMRVGPWVVDKDGHIFKNKYCAFCNGIFKFNSLPVEFSNINSDMFLDPENKNITLTEKMKLLYYDIDIEYQYIIPETSRKCLITEADPSTSNECQHYTKNPVAEYFFRPFIYRNIYCVKPENRMNDNIICIAIIHGIFDSLTDIFFPLTVLFSFEEEPTDICSREQQHKVCPSSEVYKNLEVESVYHFLVNDSLTDALLSQVAFSFLWAMTIENYTTVNSLRLWYNFTVPEIAVKLSVKVQKEMKSFDEMVTQKSLIRNVKWTNMLTMNDKVIMINTNEPTDTDFPYDSDLTVYSYWKFMNSTDVETKMRLYLNISTDSIKENGCEEIYMKSMQMDDAKLLSINNIKCVKSYQRESTDGRDQNTLTIYITYTGCSLSVLALVISVVICRKYDITSSIHGSNLENLSIIMILAKVLFMVGIGAHGNQLVCNIIGVILHYLWLAVFSFMSVAIVVLVHGITKISNPNNRQNSSRWLCLLSGCLPLLLVVPALICQVLKVKHLEPRYGGMVCFPTKFPANLIFVSGPIMLSVLINTVCLVVLVIYLAKKQGEAKKLRKSHSYQQIEVYLRVSVLTGIFWTTGIISSLTRNEVVDYIFIITCSFQGFFIALANITTRRVCRQMRPHSTLTGSSHVVKQITRESGGSSLEQEQMKKGEISMDSGEVTSKGVYDLPMHPPPTNVRCDSTDSEESIER